MNKPTKIISLFLSFSLIFQQAGFTQVAAELNISAYLPSLHSSITQDKYRPLHLRYLSYDNLNNTFNLLLDKGDQKDLKEPVLEESAKRLMEYFFVGISLPNDSFWVNLRPDSADNVIDGHLAPTGAGEMLSGYGLRLKRGGYV